MKMSVLFSAFHSLFLVLAPPHFLAETKFM